MPITTKPAQYFGHTFLTRKVIGAFMDWISDKIYVERYDELGNIYQYVKPPIQYSNVDRLMGVLRDSNNADFGNTNITVNSIFPRMSLFMVSMNYASNRKQSPYKQHVGTYDTNTTTSNTIMTPVPYNLELELSIITKSIDDTFQIIEQLAPYFTPYLPLELQILPDFDPEIIPFSLTSLVPDGVDEYGAIDGRSFTSILNLTCPINYYYIQKTGKVAKNIQVDYSAISGNEFIKFQQYELNPQNIAPTVEMTPEELNIKINITDI